MGKWVQVKDANWRIPYVGGWCQGFVEGAWGRATKPTPSNPTTSGVHASATVAWNAEPNKHTDYPPKGITVPVYFSLGSTPHGHVAIRLDDLMVASSTQAGYNPQGYIHPNIKHLIDLYAQYNKGCKYLGWGEHVGGIRVVRYEPTITTKDETKVTEIAFSTEEIEDKKLPLGETKVVQEGKNGTRTVITRVTYSDGKKTGSKVISDKTVNPVNQIIARGTFVIPEPQPEVPTSPEEPTLPVEPPIPPAQGWLLALIRALIEAINKLRGNK